MTQHQWPQIKSGISTRTQEEPRRGSYSIVTEEPAVEDSSHQKNKHLNKVNDTIELFLRYQQMKNRDGGIKYAWNGNMQGMMKQNAKLQKQMAQAQEELNQTE